MISNLKVLKALMLVAYDPIMIALALWIAARINHPRINSGYREAKIHAGDSGIHSTIPCRAMDWESQRLTDPQTVVDDINDHFEYDPERPEKKCAKFHAICPGCGFNNEVYTTKCPKCGVDITSKWHIHTQVHYRTVYYSEGKAKKEENHVDA